MWESRLGKNTLVVGIIPEDEGLDLRVVKMDTEEYYRMAKKLARKLKDKETEVYLEDGCIYVDYPSEWLGIANHSGLRGAFGIIEKIGKRFSIWYRIKRFLKTGIF